MKSQLSGDKMNTQSNKIKIEIHGVSPWHYYLEGMSWGFSRATNSNDRLAYLNVDEKFKDGGKEREDILMADFLNILNFMPLDFVNQVIQTAQQGENINLGENTEVRGNAGNYYIPYENFDGIRLAQPDGWIADENTLILLEAKGFKNSASLNKGQLAKEYLIAKSVAQNTGNKNFYVMVIADKLDNIYKNGKGFNDLQALWEANCQDFEKLFKDKYKSEEEGYPKLDEFSEAKNHFIWITWEQIRYLSDNYHHVGVAMITDAIDFHANKSTKMPIFSQLLVDLAENKTPFYHFYNGGCGNDILQEYEEQFLKEMGEENSSQAKRWKEWHNLATEKNQELLVKLTELEQKRREAVTEIKEIQKQIRGFYKEKLNFEKGKNTTRLAFGLLGESSQLENTSKIFEQRINKKINTTTF